MLFGGALVAGAVSLVLRYRRAGRELRLQLKWVAASAALVGIAFAIQAADIQDKPRQYLVALGALTIPAAFGVAILRYRLYEIDTLINRAVVYGLLTAVLAGLYTASIGLFQRFFVTLTGERSDAAVVITTLIIVSAFTPLKNSLQSRVDRQLKGVPDARRRLAVFREGVRAVTEALDPAVLRRRFLEESVAALGAVGGTLQAPERASEERCGDWSATPALVTELREEGSLAGRLALGPRRDGRAYRADEVRELKETATVVARAVAVTGVVKPRA